MNYGKEQQGPTKRRKGPSTWTGFPIPFQAQMKEKNQPTAKKNETTDWLALLLLGFSFFI
jgi:hypothetical protein